MDTDPAHRGDSTAATDITTPFGTVRVCWRGTEVRLIEIGRFAPDAMRPVARLSGPGHRAEGKLLRRLAAYFQGRPVEFDCALPAGVGTAFQRRVWDSLRKIPYGVCVTYGELAARSGLPARAARAVGGACGRNPLSIVLPCHRVVAASGALTGFAAGIAWKKALLQLEGVPVEHECVPIPPKP
jgi:methylated-DNA-[protein]-cysteine S-methyltransferase